MPGSLAISGMALKPGSGGGPVSGSALPAVNEFFVDSTRIADKPNRVFNTLNDVFTDLSDGVPSKDTTNNDIVVTYFTNDSTNIPSGLIDRVTVTPYSFRAAKISGVITATSSVNGTPAIVNCDIDGATISTTGSTKLRVNGNLIREGSTVDNTGGSGMTFENNSLDGSAGTNPVVTFAGGDFICNNRFFFGDATFKGVPNTVVNNIFAVGIIDLQTDSLGVSFDGGLVASNTIKGNLNSRLTMRGGTFASNTVPNLEEIGFSFKNADVESSTFDHQPTAATIMRFTNCNFEGNTFGANYSDVLVPTDTEFNNSFLLGNTDNAGAGSTFVFAPEASAFA